MRGQEDQRVLLVQLAQPLQALLVDVHVPCLGVQRPHQRAERVDRGRALHSGHLVQARLQVVLDLRARLPDLAREAIGQRPEPGGRGDLLDHPPRHLVAVAQDPPLPAVAGQRRLTQDEPGERPGTRAPALLRGEPRDQVTDRRGLAGHDPRRVRDAPRHLPVQPPRRPAHRQRGDQLGGLVHHAGLALRRDPRDPGRHDEGRIGLAIQASAQLGRGLRPVPVADHGCAGVVLGRPFPPQRPLGGRARLGQDDGLHIVPGACRHRVSDPPRRRTGDARRTFAQKVGASPDMNDFELELRFPDALPPRNPAPDDPSTPASAGVAGCSTRCPGPSTSAGRWEVTGEIERPAPTRRPAVSERAPRRDHPYRRCGRRERDRNPCPVPAARSPAGPAQ